MYYLYINGQQVGPVEKEKLISYGLHPETMVWREGLPNWVKASSLPELDSLFVVEVKESQPPQNPVENLNQNPNSGPYNPYNQQNQNYPYNQPGQNPFNQPNPNYRPLTNWMPWAIVATVLGCFLNCIGLILGIIAIVKASNANKLQTFGDINGAQSANSTARILTIVAFVLEGLSLIFLPAWYNYISWFFM